MLGNKHTFWQALIVALVIFWTGIILGVLFEGARADKLTNYYFDSETALYDNFLQEKILSSTGNCELIANESIAFADRIYYESKTLEKYDSSSAITEDTLRLHRRYDMLRTMLWLSLKERTVKCPDAFNTVVYLYQYDDPSPEMQAVQGATSNVLLDLKEKYGDSVILVPIAYDTDVASLSLALANYSIASYPAVIINDRNIVYGLSSVEELERYLIL